MAVADADSPPSMTPPTSDQCSHSEMVDGVMAHEFAHFDGSVGPEGVRRTVTYYGPVVGGLPISALHCERCGLLQLRYPDGRKEERQLFPGPQPGLLALPVSDDPEKVHYGMQARVSGLSVSALVMPVLRREQSAPPKAARRRLPEYGALAWTTIAMLIVTILGLFACAIAATGGYNTAASMPVWIWITAGSAGTALVLQVGGAAMRHFFWSAGVMPSVAVRARGKPDMTAVWKTVVFLLGLTIAMLFVDAILATYTYNTSPYMGVAALTTFGIVVLALVVAICGAAYSHYVDS